MDALRAIGVSTRPYSAPQSHRFESARRREAEERARRREIAYREGTGTPEDQLAQFYDNSPPAWWLAQDRALRRDGFQGGKGRVSRRAKRKARRRSIGRK